MSDEIYTSRPFVSVLDFKSKEIISSILNELSHKDISSAFIYGSFVTNTMTHWSDIDLLIVKETTLPFMERASEFSSCFHFDFPIDRIVYTRFEFNQLSDTNP